MQGGVYQEALENLIEFYTEDSTVENLVKNLIGKFEKNKDGVNNLGQIDVDFDKLEIVEDFNGSGGKDEQFDSFN